MLVIQIIFHNKVQKNNLLHMIKQENPKSTEHWYFEPQALLQWLVKINQKMKNIL